MGVSSEGTGAAVVFGLLETLDHLSLTLIPNASGETLVTTHLPTERALR